MTTVTEMAGKTTIAPEVLISIARLTTLDVIGVSHLINPPGKIGRLFKQISSDGVKLIIEDEIIYMDLFVVLKRDVNIRDVCHSIQNRVTRAIHEMVGMEVGRVNVHVEDIDYSNS